MAEREARGGFVYLDNAAGMRCDGEIMERVMDEYHLNAWKNPSCAYAEYERDRIEEAKLNILESLVEDPGEWDVIFTSGGTESNALALWQGIPYCPDKYAYEHASVYEAHMARGTRGMRPVINRVIGTHVHVCSETGEIFDVNRMAADVKKTFREKYDEERVYFHVDGTAAWLKVPGYRIGKDIDFYTISGHKVGAMKGIGALLVRKGIEIAPMLVGGGQQGGMRSGTENVPGILSLGYACDRRRVGIWKGYYETAEKLRDAMLEKLGSDVLVYRSVPGEYSAGWSPYITMLGFPGEDNQVLQNYLAERWIFVGTGSACNSHHGGSRILEGLGCGREEAGGMIRVSIGRKNRLRDIEAFAEAVRGYFTEKAAG